MLSYQNVAFTIYVKILQVIKNNKFKTSASIWNGKFELPDGYSLSYIKNYFE